MYPSVVKPSFGDYERLLSASAPQADQHRAGLRLAFLRTAA